MAKGEGKGIPLMRCRVTECTFAVCFCLDHRRAKCAAVLERSCLPGVYGVSMCDRYMMERCQRKSGSRGKIACIQCVLVSVASEVCGEEVFRDHVCVLEELVGRLSSEVSECFKHE